jgi:hypothetical protein
VSPATDADLLKNWGVGYEKAAKAGRRFDLPGLWSRKTSADFIR